MKPLINISRRRYLPRSWAVELLFLVVVLLWLKPFKNEPLRLGEEPSGVKLANAYTYALGFLHFEHFPLYAPEVSQKILSLMTNTPADAVNLRLDTAFPKNLWDEKPFIPTPFKGDDFGSVYLIYFIWKITGIINIAVVLTFLKIFYAVTTAALFLSARKFRITGFALLSCLGFALSPLLWQTLHGVFFHLFQPFFTVLCVYLFLQSLPQGRGFFRELWRWPFCALTGVVIALGTLLRSTIIILLPTLLFLQFLSYRKTRKRHELILTILLLLSFFVTKFSAQNFMWDAQSSVQNERKSHLVWHPIWCGLGEFENSYGFAWDDNAGFNFAKKVRPEVRVASDEYETILRDHVVSQIVRHPLWYLKVLCKRGINLSSRWLEFIPGFSKPHPRTSQVLFILSLFFCLGYLIREHNLRYFGFFGLAFANFSVPLLVVSHVHAYNLTAYLAILLALTYGVCAFVQTRH